MLVTEAPGIDDSSVRRLLLVPRSDGRYARVGTVATIEDVGALRNGTEALVIRGDLKEGQSILIHAGAGGVGHIAIQLAHYFDAFVALPFQVRRRLSLCDR